MARTEMTRARQRQPAGMAGQGELAAAGETAERTRMRPVQIPPTDIFETDDGLVVVADMPGVSSETVDVTLEKRVLTIRGRSEDEPPKGFSATYAEYRPADYERFFTLSEDIEAERIQAKLQDGVLRVFLPKAGPARTKRIKVQTS